MTKTLFGLRCSLVVRMTSWSHHHYNRVDLAECPKGKTQIHFTRGKDDLSLIQSAVGQLQLASLLDVAHVIIFKRDVFCAKTENE